MAFGGCLESGIRHDHWMQNRVGFYQSHTKVRQNKHLRAQRTRSKETI